MTPDTPQLLQYALDAGATNPPGKSWLHGETHWKAVALTGLFVARLTPKVSLPFIYTFALLHDVCRLNDDDDPEHGARAARLFAQMVVHPGVADFAPYELGTLDMMYALEHHVGTDHPDEEHEANPSIAVCWDADRLNLWRVGKRPTPDHLSTEVGRSEEARAYGYLLCEHQMSGGWFPSWATIRRLLETHRWP